MKTNYKIFLNITGILIIVNILIDAFTNLWGETNTADYINGVLVIFLILFATQVYSKK